MWVEGAQGSERLDELEAGGEGNALLLHGLQDVLMGGTIWSPQNVLTNFEFIIGN